MDGIPCKPTLPVLGRVPHKSLVTAAPRTYVEYGKEWTTGVDSVRVVFSLGGQNT